MPEALSRFGFSGAATHPAAPERAGDVYKRQAFTRCSSGQQMLAVFNTQNRPLEKGLLWFAKPQRARLALSSEQGEWDGSGQVPPKELRCRRLGRGKRPWGLALELAPLSGALFYLESL